MTNQPESNKLFSIVFSISVPIYSLTLHISWYFFKCFHFSSLLFIHQNPSHCYLLPGPMHSLPMEVLFLLSSPLVHSLEQNVVSGAGTPVHGELWTRMMPPWVVCIMILILSNLLKIKISHDNTLLKIFSGFPFLFTFKITWPINSFIFWLCLPHFHASAV